MYTYDVDLVIWTENTDEDVYMSVEVDAETLEGAYDAAIKKIKPILREDMKIVISGARELDL